jgi:SpoVK/Ycf46/Vps4 family AAA+-type ATPase
MTTEHRFMNELFRIINGALRLDIEKVRNYTSFLAEKLEQGGDAGAAGRLRKLLEESDHQLRPVSAAFARSLPVDEESRFPLIEKVNLKSIDEPAIALSEEQWLVVSEFVSVTKSRAQFEAEGLNNAETSTSLLMYGPPGCGKSRLARFIARELGMDLYIARLDGLISSYLGSTAKNIRALFDFASKNPCVLFLDEFDAIAKLRGDTQELGELKRVVNSFIQNLDSLSSQSIILAATNHERLLDTAVWRRFSYRIHLDYPNPELREEMWIGFLQPLQFSSKELALLVDLSEGFSGSDIREACVRLHRKRITQGKDAKLADAFSGLRNIALGEGEERKFVCKLRGADTHKFVPILRKRNARLYSSSAIADLLGVSKATAHRWMKAKGGRRA